MTQLMPCPRCEKSDRVQPQNVGDVAGIDGKTEADERWCVECWHCAHSTATFTTEAEAIAAWNTRPTGSADAMREAVNIDPATATDRQWNDLWCAVQNYLSPLPPTGDEA